MGLETESFENLERKLEEELECRNFHLHGFSSSFELRIKPNPSWMLVSMLANLFGGAIATLLFFVLFSEAFFAVLGSFSEALLIRWIHGYLNFILFAVSFGLGLRFFFPRFRGKLLAFAHLMRTEFVLTDFFLMAQESVLKDRCRMVPYETIESVFLRAGVLQKIFGVGDLVLQTKRGMFYMHSLPSHQEVAKTIVNQMKLIKEREADSK